MTATEVLCLLVPIRIYSEANGSHGHWQGRYKRVKYQRETTAWALAGKPRPSLPVGSH